MISSLLESQRLERIFKACTTVQSLEIKIGRILCWTGHQNEDLLNWMVVNLARHETGRSLNWAVIKLNDREAGGSETGRS